MQIKYMVYYIIYYNKWRSSWKNWGKKKLVDESEEEKSFEDGTHIKKLLRGILEGVVGKEREAEGPD